MLHSCPLCGKEKSKKTLLCNKCTRKFKEEYEVNFPCEKETEKTTPIMLTDREMQIDVSENENASELPIEVKPDVVSKSSSAETVNTIKIKKKRKKGWQIILWIVLIVCLLVAAIYGYKEYIKTQNIERAAWENAMRENTVNAYVSYMDAYPFGKYFADAQKNMMQLKGNEATAWTMLQNSDNTSEFQDFLKAYPDSPYEDLVKAKLDSLMWQAALKVNVAQSYTDYITLADSHEIPGEYIVEAEKRFDMLHQKFMEDQQEVDSIRLTINYFYTRLSNVAFDQLHAYLAPKLYRFFRSGNIESSKIIGELMMMAAKSNIKTINFEANTDALAYEKTGGNIFNVNVPLKKRYTDENGAQHEVLGYIAHIELNPDFKIQSVYETKPYPSAP